MTVFVDHPALQSLNTEQVAELALYGLRYQALGARVIDFNDPARLDVYWTGEKMLIKAVNQALRARKLNSPDAVRLENQAIGYLQALCNCTVITQETYMTQWHRILEYATPKVLS